MNVNDERRIGVIVKILGGGPVGQGSGRVWGSGWM